ncbi:MAG: hypothetical protein QG671_3425 [Actinomycetota bacterium]|nr:hypothetical protein [Actinomycetota bacterium]
MNTPKIMNLRGLEPSCGVFGFGVRFISRSEAKPLMRGLDRFRHVTVDFTGVEEVGFSRSFLTER